jgi:O-antigen ligase
MRPAAAAAAVPLATGVWLSYSRGAIAAAGVGLLVLAALSLTRAQLRAIAIAVVTGIPAAFVSDRLDGVRALEGTTRTRDGLVMLVVLIVLGAIAAGATWMATRGEAGRIGLSRNATVAIAVGVVLASAAGLAFVARDAGHSAASGANAERLKSLESNRYEYWKVALKDGFAKEPLKGIGAGGFGVIWLQHRDVDERARVAHSLYIETLAELGIVGFAFLLLFLGGVLGAARRVARAVPGAIAALLVFAAHCAIDWDWQVPAVSLVALALLGYVIAASEGVRYAEAGT